MTLVCPQCFGESGLKKHIQEIRRQFPNEKCNFHPRVKGIPITEVAAVVDQVFRNNFRIGEYNPHLDSQDGDDLEYVVFDLVQADNEEIARVLTEQLIEDDDDYWPPDGGEPFYGSDQCYVRDEPYSYHHGQLWNNFCESIVHKQRFFNADAKRLIAEIFDGLHFQQDLHKQSPIYQLIPGESEAVFFRARIADDGEYRDILNNPALHLGPPPARKRRPGRMNSAGISSFYGAFDLDTCVAELRPVVGSIIMGARFELTRPIFVLDTTRFQQPVRHMSLFAEDDILRVEQWRFMQNFMNEIAQPISPNDEYLDYIPTQAVAEYLLHHHEFKHNGNTSRIEAIIYRSAQYQGGRNIVLLGNAATVMPQELVPQKNYKNPGLEDTLPETMTTLIKGNRIPDNFGLRFVDKSNKILRVQSAKYDAPVWVDHYFDDF